MKKRTISLLLLPLLLLSCSSAQSEFESKMKEHLADHLYALYTSCSVAYANNWDASRVGTYVFRITWSETSSSFLSELASGPSELGGGFVQGQLDMRGVLNAKIVEGNTTYDYGETEAKLTYQKGDYSSYHLYDAKTCLLKQWSSQGYEGRDKDGKGIDYRENLLTVTWSR